MASLVAVEVALYANLRRYRPDVEGTGPFWLEVPDGTTVDALMRILGIPGRLIKQAFVDHVQQDGDYVLKDGSRIAIFSPIAGGQFTGPVVGRAGPLDQSAVTRVGEM